MPESGNLQDNVKVHINPKDHARAERQVQKW